MHARLDLDSHIVRESGPFRIRRIRPGAMLGNRSDGGFGGLGLIDHAMLSPGLTVGMHEHSNDEIISYLRQGTMIHLDSTGATEAVRPDRLMIMNAGTGFSHEEHVPGPEDVRMLQIFVRPEAASLAPHVQFVDLDTADSSNGWRHLVGPVGSAAPGMVRQQLHLHDARLEVGRILTTLSRPGFDAWLYVFDGHVTGVGERFERYDAVAIPPGETVTLTAEADADLVLFLIDRNAPASRAGTLSGR